MTAIERLLSLGSAAPWRILTLSEKHEKFCLIDAQDYDWARQWHWNFNWKPRGEYKFYARRAIGPGRTTLYLHRELMIARDPQEDAFLATHVVDHINGQSLDDRRVNLRWSTQHANILNRFGAARVPSLESIVARLLAEHSKVQQLEDVPF